MIGVSILYPLKLILTRNTAFWSPSQDFHRSYVASPIAFLTLEHFWYVGRTRTYINWQCYTSVLLLLAPTSSPFLLVDIISRRGYTNFPSQRICASSWTRTKDLLIRIYGWIPTIDFPVLILSPPAPLKLPEVHRSVVFWNSVVSLLYSQLL